MEMLNLERLKASELVTEPFEYIVVPEFIDPAWREALSADFPVISQGGSFPIAGLKYGAAFDRLVQELLDSRVRETFSRLFGLPLDDRPATLTVRGQTRLKDGRIHIDSRTKLITVLIYLNDPWSVPGGCLRLLRSEHDIDDMLVEIPPEFGTLVAFRCRPNAWHGHKPFEGQRRSMQLNWVTSDAAAKANGLRHHFSSILKRLRLAG